MKTRLMWVKLRAGFVLPMSDLAHTMLGLLKPRATTVRPRSGMARIENGLCGCSIMPLIGGSVQHADASRATRARKPALRARNASCAGREGQRCVALCACTARARDWSVVWNTLHGLR
eukprot:5852020-Pleurochrysis_carterae.AAC.1